MADDDIKYKTYKGVDGVEEEVDDDALPFYIKYKSVFSSLFVLMVTAIGVWVCMRNEGWSFLTTLYVITQIVTTVGYGDLTMNSDWTRGFMTIYVLVIIVFVAALVNDVANFIADKQSSVVQEHLAEVAARFESGDTQEQIKDSAIHRYQLTSLASSVVVFLLFALSGTIFYSQYEDCSCSYGTTKANNYANCTDSGPNNNCLTYGGGETKNFLEAFYMSIITMTTVGFGDYTPLSHLGRGLGIFWMLLGVLASGNMVSAIGATMNALTKEQQKASTDSKKLFDKLDTGNGGLDRYQFMQYMLLKNNMVKSADLDHINNVFTAKDADNSGRISWDEIEYHFAHDEE